MVFSNVYVGIETTVEVCEVDKVCKNVKDELDRFECVELDD